MTQAAEVAEESRIVERTGAVELASDEETIEKLAELDRSGVLVVRVEPTVTARGKLEETMDDAVDAMLAALGGGSPGVSASFDRESAVNDRIFRARKLGFTGLAVVLGSLAPLAAGHTSLDADDCASLRALPELAKDRPLWIFLKKRDRDLGAHARPIPLASLFAMPAARKPLVQSLPLFASAPPRSPAAASTVTVTSPSTSTSTSPSTIGACIATPEDVWRGWMLALSAARGPQSLASFERLFVEAYLPLLNALASGLDDPRARAAMLVFRGAFESTYPEAAARFQLTDKRPRMVLDAPELTMKVARSHGARMSQIVVVEAMRLDLGLHVRDSLEAALGPRASLVDELRLHAALPTTTARQLETIARGREALRTPAQSYDDLETATRGAVGLRKLRLGGREIWKLDTVDLALGHDARCTTEHFIEIADEVADAIARHAQAFRAKTLLFVTGDRGFTVDAHGDARCGGATPEEVIVPAFAFLIEPVS